ncbi:MAG: ABC transporter transmembrane domain-containing protein [Pirellulales bacterium]
MNFSVASERRFDVGLSSDTDRINNYITLTLIDFVTNCIMIVLTTIILFSINPWLTLATLTPFPFIIWITYIIRAGCDTAFC